MAIAYGSAGTRFAASAATTSYSIPYPSGIAAGDLLILFMSINGGTGVTPPSGWTTIHNETTLPNPKGGLYYKVATGSETGNLTVTLGSAVTGNGIIFRYTGVDTTNPIDATGTLVRNTTATTSIALPAITTTTANTMLVFAGGINGGTGVVSSTGGTERIDFNSPAVTGSKGGGLYDSAQAAIGASAPKTIAISQTLANWGIMVALRAASTTVAFTATASVSGSGSLTTAIKMGASGTSGTSGSGTLSTNTTLSLAVTAPFAGNSILSATGIAQMTSTNSNLEPKPYVLINGMEMPQSLTQGNAVVLENLRINNWGRTNMLDSTSPASLNMTVLDTDGAWIRGRELLGLEIIIGLRFTDSEGIARDFKTFRGRITEAECVARNRDNITGTEHGYFIYINASDKLAELGNRVVHVELWPQANYATRRDLMQSKLNGVVAGIGGSYTSGNQLLFKEKNITEPTSLLALITEHLAAGVEYVNYDPDTNRVETTGRVTFEGSTWQGLRFSLMDDGSGKYGLETDVSEFYAPFPNHFYNVDAGGFVATSGVKRSIESGITEVRYKYATTVIVNGSTNHAEYVVSTGLDENIYGRRTLTIDTENFNFGQTYADNYAKAAKAAQTWSPPDIEWDTRIPNRGFQNFVQVRNFIGGRVWHDPIFLSRSQYNGFPNKVPIYFVIGGSMTYAKNAAGVMGWVVKPNFAPVEFFTGFTPLTWASANPSTTTVLTYNDLHDNMTFTDSSLTGQGV